MADGEQHIVGLILKRNLRDARLHADEEMGRWKRDRIVQRRSAADSSRWWIQLSDIAAKHGKLFIADSSADVAKISTSEAAYVMLRDACRSFFNSLGAEYEKQYRGNRHFYSAKDAKTVPVPSHWQSARARLELDLQLARLSFDCNPGAAFAETPTALAQNTPPAPTAEPWSAAKMKSEIEVCSVPNRDVAWRKIFKPRRAEHGWDNIAFREIWSEGRGSKGTTGRPPKRA